MANWNRKCNRKNTDVQEGIKIVFYFSTAIIILIVLMVKGIISMLKDIIKLFSKNNK